MIEVRLTVTADGEEKFSDTVTITDGVWPPGLGVWRKACMLGQIMLWESHPTYPERAKALSDFVHENLDKDEVDEASRLKGLELAKAVSVNPAE